ncbi:periplasmic heavy metal sensor [Maricaulis maris]|uniref:periplasmic heavy metal sensor n=1 Tax=Maricaulis maris TaxID=74318 RepID=UPI0026EEEBF6|nr:periplasmic heavy metal sensor [Maricaulis maris]
MIWRAGVTAAILGLLGGLAGVWLGAQLGNRSDTVTVSLHAVIHDQLHLTRDQEAEIEALEADFAREKSAFDQRLAEARHAIGTSLMESREMSPEVVEAAEALHDVMGELQLSTLNHILAMRAVMDVEQREIFDARLAAALDAER